MVDDSNTRGPAEPTADGTGIASPDPHPTVGDETIVPTWGASTFASLPDPGYQLGALIGRGGMGEVVAAHDQRIGRDVAIKRIRGVTPSNDAVTRFLREARIQARLDHPAIVPVYELGTDADGRPYFTMKRLAGETLAKRLADRAPIQPLLRALVDVCLAIQLAHARGVIHRDLKPSNIMLGDYGEVYVLDWGVARVIADRKRTTRPGAAVDVDELDDSTTVGAILGTPGYMSPEQIRGHEVGPASDVYALGSMLFEILAAEPLHPRGEAALASTLTHPQAAPALRASDRMIPPELDSVCFDALAEDPASRPTARELADRVQAYLDGDRDLERRRALAASQLVAAHRLLESSTDDARATAMRHAGRALALDPQSTEAAALVTSLILEPPEALPPALVASLDAEECAFNAARSRASMWTVLSLFGFWAIIPALDIKNWAPLIAFYGLVTVTAVLSWYVSITGRVRVGATLVVGTVVVLVFTRIAGSFILTPIVACAFLISISSIRYFAERRWLLVGWTASAVMLPFVLEWIGVLHPSFVMNDGVIAATSDMFTLRGTLLDNATLIGANLIFTTVTAFLAVTINRQRSAAQRTLHIREWHLQQLLPSPTRPWQTKRTTRG